MGAKNAAEEVDASWDLECHKLSIRFAEVLSTWLKLGVRIAPRMETTKHPVPGVDYPRTMREFDERFPDGIAQSSMSRANIQDVWNNPW